MHADEPAKLAGSLPHLAALDGLRGLAVLAVVAFHLWPATIRGGWLGVDVFFVLSGFLITRLLVAELQRSGRVGLAHFWSRRARRLLPASLLTIGAVVLAAHWILGSWRIAGLRGDALASLAYVANWRFAATGNSYFSAGLPSPLEHLWSLAIEEQFYLLWPLLLWALWRLTGARPRRVAVVALSFAGISAIWMYVLADSAGSRAYFGTDTRAQALLIGAATGLLTMNTQQVGRHLRRLVAIAAPPCLLMLTAMALWVDGESSWLYRGGFALIALATALILAAVADGRSRPLTALLSGNWLRALGRMSYGLYLWHWPVIVLLTDERSGLSGIPLNLTQIAVFSALTLLSFYLIEQPIRRSQVTPRQVGLRAMPAAFAVFALVFATTFGVGGPPPQLNEEAGSVQTIPVAPTMTQAVPLPIRRASTQTDVDPPSRNIVGPEVQPPTTVAKPLKVGVVGDSVGFTLAYYAGSIPGIAISGGGTIGCGVIATGHCRDWPELWRVVGESQPDIVLINLGAWEVVAQNSADGRYRPGTPEAAQMVLDHLEQGLALLPSGAQIVLLDVPCLNSFDGQGPVATELIDWINGVYIEFALRHADRASVVPISELLCPDGRTDTVVDGVKLRPGGRHYDDTSAPVVWRWLGPRVLAAAGR